MIPMLMIVAGLILLYFGRAQIYGGKVQKEIAALLPDVVAGGSNEAAIARFRQQSDSIFAANGVTEVKKQRALNNYALLIAKPKLGMQAYNQLKPLLFQKP